MSMYRQLWLALILSTLLALIGSLFASTLNARSYLQEQLQMKNTDNATVLALSLSQKNIDAIELELTVAALFDSGHYESIRITDPLGKQIVQRVAAPEKSNIPSWFINNLPLNSQPGTAQISNGWKQVGTVSIVSNNRFAYQALWKSTLEMITALALSGLVGCYLGTLILRRLKRPLDAVIAQARAITERRFVTTPESKVPELRQLTSAMNATVTLLKSMFASEAERLESMRKQANSDTLTGLANRIHFMTQLHVMVEAEDAPPGSLIILRLSGLAEINKQFGRNKTDSLLKNIAAILTSHAYTVSEGFAARLNGTDFALLLREADADAVSATLLQAIAKELAVIDNNPAAVFIGFGRFEFGISPGALLSQVDEAVASAEIGGINDIRKAAPLNIEQAPRSSEEWSKLILRALEQQWVKLAFFPVVDFNGKLIHSESALRLMFGGEWFPAGRFLPIAERLGLTVRLDLAAVSLGLNELSRDSKLEDIAVNVSAQSIQDAGFREQLRALLLSRPAASKRLWLEIPENGVFANVDAFRAFYLDTSASGCKLGLEHFGRQFDKINLIHGLKLDYIKIDASLIRDIESNHGNQAFLKGLTHIAHNISLQVFAEGVMHGAELNMLNALGFDGATGPAVSDTTTIRETNQ
ncbi:EAL domain-containing protein [soil metagenome]